MRVPDLKKVETPPMPDVRRSLLWVEELHHATHRASVSWNATQLRDALRSARYYLDLAEKNLPPEQP